jgi:hypothetical protein
MKPTLAPLITAIVLLLLPVLYVGSYLALVTPNGQRMVWFGPDVATYPKQSYRWGAQLSERIFWPLEQIDRQLRPHAWALDLN